MAMLRLTLLMAVWAVSGCAAFTSPTPMFPPEQGVAIYGEAPVRLTMTRAAPNEDPLKAKTTFADGVYRHTVRVRGEAEESRIEESFHPFPAPAPADGLYIAQRRLFEAADPDPKGYFYALVRVESPRKVLDYDFSCRQLTPEERAGFNMAPEPGGADTAEIDCTVRSAADLAAAFRLLAGRTSGPPPVTITARPDRGGLLGLFR